MQTIKQEIIDKLKSNIRAKAALSYEFNKHQTTVERWIDSNENDSALTTPPALRIISEELGIPQSEILAEA